MQHHFRNHRVFLLAPALAVSLFAGCKKEPPPPPPAPPPAPRPRPPEPVAVSTLLQTMKADARVQFPDANAPTDEGLARAIIGFADAFAKGNADKLRPMLDPLGKQVLDQLTSSGQWDESTGKAIEAVRVSKLSGSDPASLCLAIQEPGTAYALAWTVRSADGAYVFAGAPIPNITFPRASDFDNASLTSTGPKAPSTADTPEGKAGKPAEGEAPAPEESPADGPKRRNTPAGPVTIPDPSKPGGG